MSPLLVRAIFSTLQGEGSQAGRPSIFIRLSGCNLWSGQSHQRHLGRGACASWCDTEFVGGDRLLPADVVDRVLELTACWKAPHVTITGGEPCLQLRRPQGEALVSLLTDQSVDIAIETNGSIEADVLDQPGLHVTVSPKRLLARGQSLDHIIVRHGTDLKVVVPQWSDSALIEMATWRFDHLFVQPLDDGRVPAEWVAKTTTTASRLGARVSVQVHKLIGVP